MAEYYKVLPGVEIVPLGNGRSLFCSEASQAKVEGEFAATFAGQIVPLLDGRTSLAEVCREIPELIEEDLRARLDQLVEIGVLSRSSATPVELDPRREAFYNFHSLLGIEEHDLKECLSSSKVAIVGLEGFGAQVALNLAELGIGQLTLVDPYPCEPGNLPTMGGIALEAVGTSREQVVADEIRRRGILDTKLKQSGSPLNESGFGDILSGVSAIVGGYDKGFSATNHWINRFCLETDTPAFYGMAAGHLAQVGPTVVPGQSACYMCYRMRVIACEENFEEAMTYEEFLNAKKTAQLHLRPGLPSVHAYISSLATVELLRIILVLSPPALVNKSVEFDALSMSSIEHPVLARPDCEACKKKRVVSPTTEKHALRKSGALLISPLTGIAKTLQRVPKDVSEPAIPYVYRTYLGNHQFIDDAEESSRSCSGKGFTREDAIVSALGETVERYSASFVQEDAIRFSKRTELTGRSLDPRHLVLFAEDQYESLPYAPYQDNTVLGWVKSNSEVYGDTCWIPAIAVFLNYHIQSPGEYLFPITSNGLAAGATLQEAILRAALEVIERDAVMCMWLNKMACRKIDCFSHPDDAVRQLCKQYADRNVVFELFEIPTDHPCHVFFAVGFDESPEQTGPAAVVGMGADLDPVVASRRAILEVAQVRPALRRRMWQDDVRTRRRELLDSPSSVETLDDHDLLYTNDELLVAFDFLRQRPLSEMEWNVSRLQGAGEQLDRLTRHFREKDIDLIWHDLTSEDMREFGVHTVRVVISGFQPIHFGFKERRLGGDRLFDLPSALGQAASRTTRDQLNPLPHPVA